LESLLPSISPFITTLFIILIMPFYRNGDGFAIHIFVIRISPMTGSYLVTEGSKKDWRAMGANQDHPHWLALCNSGVHFLGSVKLAVTRVSRGFSAQREFFGWLDN
jgi:hypothetical protein